MSFDPQVVTLGKIALDMNSWTIVRDLATLTVGGTAAMTAALAYKRNAQTRRAEFICQLHKAFFEDETYRNARQKLDTNNDAEAIAFVIEESDDFTDFLNFFELVAYLQRRKNLSLDDVGALLGYYLSLLCRKPALRGYIRDKAHGFEELDRLLLSWNAEHPEEN